MEMIHTKVKTVVAFGKIMGDLGQAPSHLSVPQSP